MEAKHARDGGRGNARRGTRQQLGLCPRRSGDRGNRGRGGTGRDAGPTNARRVNAKADAAALAGHNAWMLTSSALVLFMTAPGLAMFYGGLVRKKNVLGVMMQCLFLMGLMTVIWALYGYSLAFGDPACRRSSRTSATASICS